MILTGLQNRESGDMLHILEKNHSRNYYCHEDGIYKMGKFHLEFQTTYIQITNLSVDLILNIPHLNLFLFQLFYLRESIQNLKIEK